MHYSPPRYPVGVPGARQTLKQFLLSGVGAVAFQVAMLIGMKNSATPEQIEAAKRARHHVR